MRLRFHTLLNRVFYKPGRIKKTLFFLILLLSCPVFSQSDIKKEASKLFEEEEYTKAYKLYSQLVANYPKDPEYNYKLGVCMIFSEPDKKKSLPYLMFAKRNMNDETKDAVFWLGKANHINYLFDEAIKNYTEFKKTASASKQKKLQVDREIAACSNGKKLLSNLTDLVVTSKKELDEADYFRSYDLKGIGGKLLVKPDDFKTPADKKKKENSVVYLPSISNRVYYSSYGDDPQNGRDIYFSVKMADGTFSKGEKVKGINTPFDEDYPFLHPNGQVLYFASKGHNSMGGYDIFRSTYIESSDSWSEPVNMEFPINSPDDDYLFVTDSLEKTAYFSTGRQSMPGKTDVLRINTERKPIDVLVISGNVLKSDDGQSRKSTINVKKASGEGITRIYNADNNGDYSLDVPNGTKLVFTVETPGRKTQSQEVELPLVTVSKPLRQTISYPQGQLTINNYFDEAPSDTSYLQYLKVIEKKARLDVNQGENNLTADAGTAANTTPKKNSSAPQLVDQSGPETTTTNSPAVTMDNKQLAAIAKQDVVELKEEARKLEQDSKDALEVGSQQKEIAAKKMIDADDLLKNAETIQNEDDKKQTLEKATLLKQEAENETAVANRILAFGKSLEEDAALKKQEAQLNESYAQALDKTISAKDNSSESQAKLDDLQKQISALGEQKNKSDDLFNSIKSEIEEKEKRIALLEQKTSDTKLAITEIKTVISENEAQLEKTRKKKDKEALVSQNTELTTEQAEKETQIAKNAEEIKKTSDELAALKNELELTNRIKTETIATVITPSTTVAVNTTTSTAAKTNKSKNQPLAANTKKPGATTAKTANAKTTPSVKKPDLPDYTPLSAGSASEAVTRLDNLDNQLTNSTASDRDLFDFNGYQSPQAQNLKIEADAKINEAAVQQKQLKETIVTSKEEIKATPAITENKITPALLSKEADDMVVKAQELRTDAGKKEGEEKEKLLTEAKDLETKADEKYIQASGIMGSDNKALFDNNLVNIQKLTEQNKASEPDLANAKKLNDEAVTSFKQALAIREEANSLGSNGAKLGSLSNAEEIEAEALAKQQQAVAILRKTSPDLALSTAATSTTQGAPAAVSPELIASGLQKVNSGVNDLATAKLQSYQKLYEANTAEIDQINISISTNQSTLDKTPGLKNEFLSTSGKLQTVRDLKLKSDESATPGEKLSNLSDAVKKQLEVIKQLNKVNTALNKIVESNATVAQQNKPANTESTVATTTPTIPTETGATPTPTLTDNGTPPAADLTVVDPATLAGNDTTSIQLISYLDKNTAEIKNPQAENSVRRTLANLKADADEIASIDEKIKNYQPGETTDETPAQLKTKADGLLVEAETLSGKAFSARKTAEEKSGAEKDSLMTQSEALEKESQDKKLEASGLTLKANTQDYKTNSAVITELIGKLKTDNPAKAEELESKNNESEIIYNQTKQLRDEANGLTNVSAKLGALSNAEEKEAENNQKQMALLDELKKLYPDYVMKGSTTTETPESLNTKKNELLEKQYNDLTNLTNSFSLEYEASKNSVPENLSPEQARVKQNAEELNSGSKQLLIKAATESNSHEKIKLLSLAAKNGNAAIGQLNKLVPQQKSIASKNNATDKALKTIGDNLAGTAQKTKTPAVKKPAVTKTQSVAAVNNRGAVRIEGLEVLKGNAYNDDRPIPIDSKMEDGLTFRVQIGAFKTRLPNNAFRGLSPLNGETTTSGYIRYTAGNFNRIENANAVKNDLRSLGYSDAFVVVYYNGKRISLNEALAIMEKEGKTIDANAPSSAGITANSNIPKSTTAAQNPDVTAKEQVIVTNELEKLNGLLFTVQIGVYTKEVTSSRLLNLKPIFTERLNNGLYRYTAGIYNNPDRLVTDKNKVVLLGVKDAFVSAYLNGKRIPFSEGKTRQTEDSTVKMETENPILFPDVTANSPVVAQPPVITPAASTVQPFKNDVTSYPAVTVDNGVKATEEGITFKVQIGAYSKQVPEDVAAKFSSIKTWPVENKQINTLFIYNIGNFSEPRFAKALKEEVVRLGIADAFITVYRDGVKLYGTDAASLLSR